jgi:RNA polymerase sigma-70 factor (ECF subfamily)
MSTASLENASFRVLIERVRSKDQAAATELVRRYEPTIRRVARVRLVSARLHNALESMDICQSVFGSFFVRAGLGQYDLETPEELLRLLVSMSRKKVIDHVRRQCAARRDFRRMQAEPPDELQCVSPDPTPSQQVAADELLREFRRRMSPEERYLAEQRALGRDWAQIAAEKGGSAEALRKQLTRAIDRVSLELGLESAS